MSKPKASSIFSARERAAGVFLLDVPVALDAPLRLGIPPEAFAEEGEERWPVDFIREWSPELRRPAAENVEAAYSLAMDDRDAIDVIRVATSGEVSWQGADAWAVGRIQAGKIKVVGVVLGLERMGDSLRVCVTLRGMASTLDRVRLRPVILERTTGHGKFAFFMLEVVA